MPKAEKSRSKQPAPAPYKVAPKAETQKPAKNPLFEERKLRFGIGGALRKNVDLSRFVKWPKYVKLQRQRKVLYERLKVPPSLALFSNTLDKNTATSLFRVLAKYKPESKDEKKARLKAVAQAKADGAAQPAAKKPVVLKYGLNHITSLVEQNKAKLVVIAHDVDPIELVLWLPSLCRKKDIPFAIVKSKARLGQLVHKKTATAIAVTGVNKEDEHDFAQLLQSIRGQSLDKYDDMKKTWGGGAVGIKSQHKIQKRKAAIQKEVIQKLSA